MANKLELKSLGDQLSLLKTLTQTYQQIAANHIRRTRSSVVKNRDFITELRDLFQEVKHSYKDQLDDLIRQKKKKDDKKFSMIQHNGKTTAVFIAANTGLYGGIITKTVELFNDYLKKNKADPTIIGTAGEALFKVHNPGMPYTFFDFPDTAINPEKLRGIVTHLLQYDKILVFYAQFQSIVAQNPTISSLDTSIVFDENENVQPSKHYLFEPSLEEIIVFFETEIFGLVFEQTLRESQLAKQASRMYSLDNAIQNINKRLDKNKMQNSILHHRTINTKQINSLAGMSLWSGSH